MFKIVAVLALTVAAVLGETTLGDKSFSAARFFAEVGGENECLVEVASNDGFAFVDGYGAGVSVERDGGEVYISDCEDRAERTCSRLFPCTSDEEGCVEFFPCGPTLGKKSLSANSFFEEVVAEGECAEVEASNDGLLLVSGYGTGVSFEIVEQGFVFSDCNERPNKLCSRFFPCTSEDMSCFTYTPSEDACTAPTTEEPTPEPTEEPTTEAPTTEEDPVLEDKSYAASKFFALVVPEGACAVAIEANIGFFLVPGFGSGVSVEEVEEGVVFSDCKDREGRTCSRFFPCTSSTDQCTTYLADADACTAPTTEAPTTEEDPVLEEKSFPASKFFTQVVMEGGCAVAEPSNEGYFVLSGFGSGVTITEVEDGVVVTSCFDRETRPCSRFFPCTSSTEQCTSFTPDEDACTAPTTEAPTTEAPTTEEPSDEPTTEEVTTEETPILLEKSLSAAKFFSEIAAEESCVSEVPALAGLLLVDGYRSGVTRVEDNGGVRFLDCLDIDNKSCSRFFPCFATQQEVCTLYIPDEAACEADSGDVEF